MFNKLVRNSRSMLILGVLLAAIAFLLAFVVLSSKASGSPASQAAGQATPGPVGDVLFAKTEVQPLTQITDAQSAVALYFNVEPAQQYVQAHHGYIPPDYVQGQSALEALLAQGPRHLSTKLSTGDPLLASEVVSNTTPGGVDYSPLLKHGWVAETISVQPVAAGNGNIQVSDRVDMLVSYKLPLQGSASNSWLPGITSGNPATAWETQTTLQNLPVLNVASTNYTLAVRRQDALLLKWVKDTQGTVDLVVRAAEDSGSNAGTYQTTAIVPDYLAHDPHMSNPFIQPQP